MITIQLTTGAELQLKTGVPELVKAIETALQHQVLVELDGEDGRAVILNPQHVLYIREGEPDPVDDKETVLGAMAASAR